MSHYQRYLCRIRSDPLNPDSLVDFEEIFTNLVLLQGDGRAGVHLTYTDLLTIKINGQPQMRLIVQGEAGAGKTTLCSKIAWDWINGNGFEKFTMVLVVPLRDVENVTIGEIAKAYLSETNPVTVEQLNEYIFTNQDKVFIIFDGLDEFSKNISHPCDWDIIRVLRSELLKKCLVLVTSRPWMAIKVRWNQTLRKLYSFIHVEGFSKKNLSAYILKFFKKDETKAKHLIQVTVENDIIAENMAPYPIYAAMLCLMWRELEEEKREQLSKFQTFSQLFDEMFLFLKTHYALKNAENVEEKPIHNMMEQIDEAFDKISKIACDGLLNDDLTFKKQQFEEYHDCIECALKVGILTEERKIISWKSRENSSQSHLQSTIFFPHKLFQEYMAGKYLASLYTCDKDRYTSIIQTVTQKNKKFRYLLYFTVHQNHEVGKDVIPLISQSDAPTDDLYEQSKQDFLVDVTLECHDTAVAEEVRKTVLDNKTELTISKKENAHTVAGYMFILKELVSSFAISF